MVDEKIVLSANGTSNYQDSCQVGFLPWIWITAGQIHVVFATDVE